LKIAIAGAGVTGSYLYRLLSRDGNLVSLFEKTPNTQCGISSCAWGTSKGFTGLVRRAGLDPSSYILNRSDHVMIDGMKIKAELITFDKPKFIEDLREGATIEYGVPAAREYDRVVDCTGVSRAFLPPARDDVVLQCIQYRVRASKPLENEIRLRAIGYSWCFPLSESEYHIGCGSLLLDPRQVLKELGWLTSFSSAIQVVCGCSEKIRLAAPHYSQPYIAHGEGYEIWGVGEAIGCVAPLAGDGIVPGMRSVNLLIEHWDDPDGYTAALLKEFNWMKAERRVIDKLLRKEKLGLLDAWTLKRNSKRMSMTVKLGQAAALMKHLQ
jgi:flavin-dependent dehydrogenase